MAMKPTMATIPTPRTAMSMPRGPGIQSMRGRSVQAMMHAARTPRMTVEMGLKKKRVRMTTTSQAEGASQMGRERGVAPLDDFGVSMGREGGESESDINDKDRGGGGICNF